MKKLPIAMAVLAAAVCAGPLVHLKNLPNTTKPTVPSTIQADFPIPTCPPDCALPTPTQVPK